MGRFAASVQATFVDQYHPAFRSPYRGPNSLDPGSRGDETFDATLFLGLRLPLDVELHGDLEIDQGFGLSDTLGAAGYVSGEAYKVGAETPYFRVPRLFFRYTADLGGRDEPIQSAPDQLAGTRTHDNVTFTIGKFSAVDIFDTNAYAHDPRADFFNWAIIDAGAFDYAADAWGYSYGVAVEWTQNWWTLRVGLFDLSRVPNSRFLQHDFSQFEAVSEFELRSEALGRPGKIKLLGFVNRGRMADYSDAVGAAAGTGNAPDAALVRNYRSRPGIVLNLEQQVGDDWGVFARASWNDGSKEAYEFTEINRSLSAGASVSGNAWDRPNDVLGVAGVANGLSASARRYFGAGGLGILIGDRRLTHYAPEEIVETYYRLGVREEVAATFDYQLLVLLRHNL
jgi:high affinity Mn2+ porin